jgi:predicted Zn-dependent peptidase
VDATIDSLALPNGLRILVQTDPAQPKLSAGLWVGAGWVHNPRGQEGLADLAAATDLRRARQAVGAGRAGKPEMVGDLQLNVATDHTFFTASGQSGDLDAVLSALAAVIPPANETFEAAPAMKEEALTNLLRTRRAPGLVAREAMSVALFGDRRPLGRSARFQTLLGVLPVDLVRFHADFYRPGNSALVVGGPVKADEVRAAASRAFGDWPAGTQAAPAWARAAEAPSHAGVTLIDEPDARTAIVLAGLAAPGRESKDYAAVQLLNHVLGSSRIEDPIATLVATHPEGYQFRSQHRSSARGSEITLEVVVPHSLAARVMTDLQQNLAELQRSGLDQNAIEAEKAARRQSLAFRFESPLARLREAASLMAAGAPIANAADPERELEALDPTAVNALWQTLLAPDKVVWIVHGRAAELAPALAKAGLEVTTGDVDQVVTGKLYAPPPAAGTFTPGAASTAQAEELILAAIAAKGGLANLERIRAYALAETLFISPSENMQISSGERKTLVEYPDRFREDIAMGQLQGRGVVHVMNGSHFWRSQIGKVGPVSDVRRQDLLNRIWLDSFRMFHRYAEPGAQAYMLDPIFLGGRTIDGFQINSTDGNWARYYLHPESRLVVKRISQRWLDKGMIESQDLFTDYRSVEGILMPFISANYLGDEFTTETHLGTVEINPTVDEEQFAEREGS